MTGTFWFPRAFAESDMLTAAWPPSVKCRTCRHGDAQKPGLAEELGFSLSKGAACRKARPGERSAEPCPAAAQEPRMPRRFFPVPPTPAAPSPGLAWRGDSQRGCPCCLLHVGFSERADGGNRGAGNEGCV